MAHLSVRRWEASERPPVRRPPDVPWRRCRGTTSWHPEPIPFFQRFPKAPGSLVAKERRYDGLAAAEYALQPGHSETRRGHSGQKLAGLSVLSRSAEITASLRQPVRSEHKLAGVAACKSSPGSQRPCGCRVAAIKKFAGERKEPLISAELAGPYIPLGTSLCYVNPCSYAAPQML